MPERDLFLNALLGLVCAGPVHGYELASRFGPGGELEAVGRIGRSQVYALLKTLEGQGLVTVRLEEAGGGPPRRVFEATPAGRRRFLAWVREPVGSVRRLRVEFPLKFYLARQLGPRAAAGLVRRQEEELGRALRDLRARTRSGVGRWVDGLRIRLLEAGLAWLSDLARELHGEDAP